MVRGLYILKLLGGGIRRRPFGTAFTLIAWWFVLCQFILVLHAVTAARQVKSIRGTTSTMIAYIQGVQQQRTIESIRARITVMDEVSDVTFIPRQAGLDRLKGWLGSGSPLIEGLDASILPDAFEVGVKPLYAGRTEDISTRLKAIPGIEDVHYDRGILGYIADAYRSILIAGAVIAVIVVVCLWLVIFLSIRVSIVTRRQEIEVLRILGAQGSFLYAPYLLEALIYGLGGALLALLATEIAVERIISHAPVLKSFLSLLQTGEIAFIIVSSSFLSLLGGYLAIKRSVDG